MNSLEIEALRVEREAALQELGKERRYWIARYEMRWGIAGPERWVQMAYAHDCVQAVENSANVDAVCYNCFARTHTH